MAGDVAEIAMTLSRPADNKDLVQGCVLICWAKLKLLTLQTLHPHYLEILKLRHIQHTHALFVNAQRALRKDQVIDYSDSFI